MAELIEDIDIYPRMLALAGALEAELKRRGVPAASVAVLPEGLPTIDYFGDDCEGYGWVRLATAAPYTTFPAEDTATGTCDSLLAYTLEVGYAHCAPNLADDGTPPSTEEQIEATRVQTSAMAAMRSAIRTAMNEADSIYVLGQYQAALQGGGMLGAIWPVTVGDRLG